mmetsp:Transcript_44066/g.104353  ORF Transcript_44066/g.104353 Transcript_44066/m.104353 type:complete len:250 (-) Transcript_44066:176-925(-)
MTSLSDSSVTLAPYFKLKDAAKFRELWKSDFAGFKHKEDCVHYSFCFEGDARAHCREAYTSAATTLQHLGDVDAPLKAVLDPAIADLERLEVHGPASELEKLKEALTPLGAKFFTCEWGFRTKKPAMEQDTVVHFYPYFKMKDEAAFKKIWQDAYAATQAAADAEKSFQYAFSFDGSSASCRESYGDADGILLHLKNVDGPFKACLAVAELERLEVHGPPAELEKLKPALDPLGAQYFALEWGFRNATN